MRDWHEGDARGRNDYRDGKNRRHSQEEKPEHDSRHSGGCQCVKHYSPPRQNPRGEVRKTETLMQRADGCVKVAAALRRANDCTWREALPSCVPKTRRLSTPCC